MNVPGWVTTPLFSDGATKRRTVRLPPGTSAVYDPTAAFGFPDGTVFTKSFGFRADARDTALPIQWIETRVEWKARGSWNFMAYRWNDAGTQAIAEPGGEVVDLSFVDVDGVAQNAHYLVPSQLQCEQCHSESGAVAPIGPKARLLNTDQAYDGGTENQLAHWSRLGILSGAPDPASAPKLPAAADPDACFTEDVETRCGRPVLRHRPGRAGCLGRPLPHGVHRASGRDAADRQERRGRARPGAGHPVDRRDAGQLSLNDGPD